MKIGILTFQRAFNIGAMLQAYALLDALKKDGYEVRLIDYRSPNQLNPNIVRAYWSRRIYYAFHRKALRNRQQLFYDFQNELLELEGRSPCVTDDLLHIVCREFDAIICGSDQVWTQDKKVYDRSDAYFINFEYKGTRIAYAVSFGDRMQISASITSRIIPYIKRFDFVSVREIDAYNYLMTNHVLSKLCIDPVFFLTKLEWERIARNAKIDYKYILYYSVNSRKYSIRIAKKIAQETGLKVIEVNPHPRSWNSGFKKYYACGPREFISLIKNAEMVVTNSFHGTAFSVIFHKKFFPVFDLENGVIIEENRKRSLLNSMGLEWLITTEENYYKNIKINVNWEKIDSIIASLRKDSFDFLNKSLGKAYDRF